MAKKNYAAHEVIALPSASPGGLNARRSGHFGTCDVFTIVTVGLGQVIGVEVVKNIKSTTAECGKPVEMLLQKKVDAVIVNNIGRAPFRELRAAGIPVLLGKGVMVNESVKDYLAGKLSALTEEYVCDGQEHPRGD